MKNNVNQLNFDFYNDIKQPLKEIKLKEIDTTNERIKAEINWKNSQPKKIID